MKNILKLFLAFLFTLTVVSVMNPTVTADEHEGDDADDADRKVVLHYHRWDGDYEGRTLWTWETGTDTDNVPLAGESDFGGTFEIPIGEDAGDEIGLILRYGAGWGDGQTDRDGLNTEDSLDGDTPNKGIVIRDEDGDFDGFNEAGEKHVFVYEGMADVIYQDDMFGPMLEDTGTLSVVFYDPDEYNDIPDWEIWTWGAGENGFVANNDDGGIPLDTILGVDGQLIDNAHFRVAHIPVGDDAEDEIGLLFRTLGSWTDQTDDFDIDVTDIKDGGFKTVFFGGNEEFDSFEALENFALPAEIESASALDPGSILVEFNKNIAVMEDEEVIFDENWFSVEDSNGNVIDIDMISYTQGTGSVEEFMLSFPEGTLNASDAPYEVMFQSDPDNEETRTTYTVEISDEVPSIRIVGSQSTSLELGDEYALPSFSATEYLDGESRPLYEVRVKEDHGYLSTREAGVYEIVIEAEDTFGNIAEETITITVMDPCNDEAHLANPNIPQMIYGTVSGLSVLALGAFAIVRLKGGKQ